MIFQARHSFTRVLTLGLLLGFILVLMQSTFALASPGTGGTESLSVASQVYADPIDDFNGTGGTDDNGNNGGGSGISDMLGGNGDVITDESSQQAQEIAAPLVKFIGTAISLIMMLTFTIFFFITALDLLYITVPFIRTYLADATQNGGGATMGMGGMGGFGGMGGGMGGGGQQNAGKSILGKQWVSDEAVAAAANIGGASASQGQQMGGMGMGGFGGGMQQTQQASKKSVMGEYLKSRLWVMVLLGICLVFLTSTMFVNTGMLLAEWILGLLGQAQDKIPS